MNWLIVIFCLMLEGVSRIGVRCDTGSPTAGIKFSAACYGSGGWCTLHKLTCGNLGIHIVNASYGFKNKSFVSSSQCSLAISSCSTDYFKRCCYLKSGDLLDAYKQNHIKNLIETCYRKSTCNFIAPRTTRSVNPGVMTISSFSLVYYRCFNTTTGKFPTTLDPTPAPSSSSSSPAPAPSSSSSSPVAGIVGGVLAVVVIAVVVVVGALYYRRKLSCVPVTACLNLNWRRQQKNNEPAVLAKKQKFTISDPSALCSINGVDVGITEDNEYSQIDEHFQTESDRVVTPYKITNVGTEGGQNQYTNKLATRISDDPSYKSPISVSEQDPTYKLATEIGVDEPTHKLAIGVLGDDPTYSLAAAVPEDDGRYNTLPCESTPGSYAAGRTEEPYNHMTSEPARLISENDYSHATGSEDRQGEDPDYGYDHFDDVTRVRHHNDDYNTMQTCAPTSGEKQNTSDYNTSC